MVMKEKASNVTFLPHSSSPPRSVQPQSTSTLSLYSNTARSNTGTALTPVLCFPHSVVSLGFVQSLRTHARIHYAISTIKQLLCLCECISKGLG